MGFRSFFSRKKKSSDSSHSSNAPNPQISQQTIGGLVRPQIQIEELKQVFQKIDANGDGKISASELGAILSSIGYAATEDELKRMINAVDADGDGCIDLKEFIALNTNGIDSEEFLANLKDAFSVYDIDGNGSISAEELQKVLRSLGDECSITQCRNMISGVDSDGDGMISFEEFRAMMTVGFNVSL